MAPTITVIGDLLEDVVVQTSVRVHFGTDNPAQISRTRGGSGANVAVAAAAAGATARFIGRVGEDRLGRALADDLAATGVEARLQRGGRSGSVVVHVDAAGERTMFPDRAAAAHLDPIDPADLAGTDVLHLPLYGFLVPATAGHLRDAAAAVRAAGGRVTMDLAATSAIEKLDAHLVVDLIRDLAVSVVFANTSEAAAVALTTLTPPGDGSFVIKGGRRPAVIVHGDGRQESVPAQTVEAVLDSTGAGDAFAGTFLAHWGRGESAVDAVAAAHLAASAVLGIVGAGQGSAR